MIKLNRIQGIWTMYIVKRTIEITFAAPELGTILNCIQAPEYKHLFNGERIITAATCDTDIPVVEERIGGLGASDSLAY